MHPILKAGLVIGVACAVWMFVFGAAGWYRDPATARLFFLVVVIEIAGLWWGLGQTAREGRTYTGQVVAGTMMAIIAGVVIIPASLVFTMAVFPAAMERLRADDPSTTPMAQALGGFMGTLITGILVSAVIAIRVRAPRA